MRGICKYCGSKANHEVLICTRCLEKLELCGRIIEMVKQAKEERDRGTTGKRH